MKINVIGDSHVAALGPQLQRLLPEHDVWFKSNPGYSTARLVEYFGRHEPRPADLTIIVAGGNDFGDRSRERGYLLETVTSTRGGRVLWVGPAFSTDAAVNARHRMQADAQHEQFELLGVRWLDSYPATQTGHGGDGVHFTRDGYARWAEAIAAGVKRKSWWPVIVWAAILGVVGGIFYKTLRLGKR